ncbi:Abi-alpha family protein [Fructilactobacillus florum]|uniref:Abi-alpha family protein n=1 Tax=Fructilactobacillus florum TaxID=640331 RepID=UPI0006CF6E76|nr:Abi-alpha family protein [Fructilactobacillus florum]
MNNNNNNILPTDSINKLFGPSCEAVGQAVGAIFNFTFSRLIKYNIIKKSELDDLANGVAENAHKIPENNLDDSKIEQILNIIEKSKYSISNAELRELYKNIIVNSLDNRKNRKITNYFATIISNLSPESVIFLNGMVKIGAGSLPIIKANALKEPSDIKNQFNPAYKQVTFGDTGIFNKAEKDGKVFFKLKNV